MKITIMTEPLSAYYRCRTVARKYIRHIPCNYGGHYSVTRSLFDGFRAIGFNEYNYRPVYRDIAEHVHVLSGIPALRYAIALKQKGLVKRLTAGPNIIAYADQKGWEYLLDENVNQILFPSQNNADYFCRYLPELKKKTAVFASGIDESQFKPKNMHRKYVLVYLKHVSEYWGNYISYILKKHGFQPYIIKYGSYHLSGYKSILNRSKFMISISLHDTQGLYLAEAWAMDCPTVCYNSHFRSFPGTKTYVAGNQLGSPYVCSENGAVFDSMSDLERILKDYRNMTVQWHAREWVLRNMTDAVCSRHFLELIRERECV